MHIQNDYIDTKYTNAQIPPGNKSTSPSLGSILIAVVHYVRIVELGLLDMQMTQNQEIHLKLKRFLQKTLVSMSLDFV